MMPLGLIAAKTGIFAKKGGCGAFCCSLDSVKIRESGQFAPDIEEFLPTLLANRLSVQVAQLVKGLGDGVPGGRDRGGRVAVSAADRLGQDAVDDAESQHVLGGDLHA